MRPQDKQSAGPLGPLYQHVDRDVVPERWRQHKTWRTQTQPDKQWDEGLGHYLARLKRSETPAARRNYLVKLVTFGLAALEDLDRSKPAARLQPTLDFDPEASLR